MNYSQKDYSEKLGNSEITIAQGGALLVAFTNLLNRMGFTLDPIELNELLKVNGAFSGEDGDLLSWTAPAHIAPQIGISDDKEVNGYTIYQLKYAGVDGTDKFTYAIIDPNDHDSIIDSYDGISKKASVYGEVVDFTTYHQYPALVATYSKPVSAPVETSPDTYEVVAEVDGYGTADDAINRTNPIGKMPLGGFYVFDQKESALNLTNNLEGEGWWINAEDNIVPVERVSEETQPTGVIEADAPVVAPTTPVAVEDDVILDLGVEDPLPETATPEESEEVNIPVRVLPPDPNKWQNSWKKFLNIVNYRATVGMVIADLTGEQPNKSVKVGTILPIAGTFEKDGITYFRTAKSVQDGHWYGIPENTAKVIDDEDDDINAIMDQPTPARDKLIKAGATTEGKIKKIFTFGKKK